MTQTILASLLLIISVYYVLRRSLTVFAPKKKPCGCGGCGCGDKARKTLSVEH